MSHQQSLENDKCHLTHGKILLVVGAGGFTHAAPVLELGRILAQRGHRVEFATHQGQEKWVKTKYYNFVTKVHTMGPGLSPEVEAQQYRDLQASDPRVSYEGYFKPKYTVDQFWTSDYFCLQEIVAEYKPDMMIADFFVDAVRDIGYPHSDTPFAMVWPQMPYGMVKVSYIPGVPGFQTDALSSEHASFWTRLRAELRPLRAVPAIVKYLRWVRKMRRDAGVNEELPLLNKPNHLALVNSFWGLEVPKDLPPMIAAVGPILADEYPPLDGKMEAFFSSHRRIMYVSFGTHIQLEPEHLAKFLTAFSAMLREDLVDGVIWAANEAQSKVFSFVGTVELDQIPGSRRVSVTDIINNQMPEWYFTPFAPQRTILDRPETVLFVTHGGGSSVNEAMFHGTPMLALGFFFDQPLNGLRIQEAGVGLAMDKAGFSGLELVEKCRTILTDADGSIGLNVTRMKHIARVASRNKHHAADLIEEVMYDRKYGAPTGRPWHLQTADMRMSVWRAGNWDLTAFGGVALAGMVGLGYYVFKYRSLIAQIQRRW
ncbi:UDP-glucosyl transferase family protein [Cladorrhinum sp. PSN259]|nr:UDP-glucosyl transferase family protein [Cladorrhinum sp. PSN259]